MYRNFFTVFIAKKNSEINIKTIISPTEKNKINLTNFKNNNRWGNKRQKKRKICVVCFCRVGACINTFRSNKINTLTNTQLSSRSVTGHSKLQLNQDSFVIAKPHIKLQCK